MPTIEFAGETIECLEGANLRLVLIHARLPLYTRVAKAIHCRGNGACGTCAVRIEGPVSEPTPHEMRRLKFPPHQPDSGLRLACQCSVLGNLKVTKFGGIFGQQDEEAER